MRLAVVGSGYVGLVAGACLAELGHQVTLVDNDEEKLEQLRGGGVPIHEQHLPELIARNVSRKRLAFSESLPDAVRDSQVVFIAVGTPAMESGEPDLSYVDAVARVIAKHVGEYKLIVEKSTVPVLTHEKIRDVMKLNGAPMSSFDVVSNPEFLREGTAVTDFLYPDRIVIGADHERSTSLLRELYAPLTSGAYYQQPDAIAAPVGYCGPPELILTSARSAELIKHASNAFLAMKISFINAVANLCEAVGADVKEVCHGIGSDKRIGQKFLQPGIGYGGSCFPKDLSAFLQVAQQCGLDFALLDEVRKINDDQRKRFLKKVHKVLWTLKGKRLAALGLSFKGGTDDIRESPAIAIIQALLDEGADVAVYDPAATERAQAVLSGKVTYAASPYEACNGAHALLVLTDWSEFTTLDLARVRAAMQHPIVIDGRNLFHPEQMAAEGFQYYGIGRSAVAAEMATRA